MATGGTMGLAKEIINGAHVLYKISLKIIYLHILLINSSIFCSTFLLFLSFSGFKHVQNLASTNQCPKVISREHSIYLKTRKTCQDKTGVINDPLGQTHNLASSEHYFRLKFVLFCEKWERSYERTTCAKTIINTGRDCGSAEWINIFQVVCSTSLFSLLPTRIFQEGNCYLHWLITNEA